MYAKFRELFSTLVHLDIPFQTTSDNLGCVTTSDNLGFRCHSAHNAAYGVGELGLREAPSHHLHQYWLTINEILTVIIPG